MVLGKRKSDDITPKVSKISFNTTMNASNTSTDQDEKKSSDPLDRIPEECHDLIFQHFLRKKLLSFANVSRTWKNHIGNSFFVMNRIIFQLNPDSKDVMEKSTRRYQSVKVKHEIMNQDSNFLSTLVKFMTTIRSLSFEGIFEDECVEHFFNQIDPEDFKLEHLTFIGEKTETHLSTTRNLTNTLLMISKFATFKEYKSITLVDLSSNTFSDVLKHLLTKTLILQNMKLMKSNTSCFEYFQKSIETLEMSMMTIVEETIQRLIYKLINLKTILIDDLEKFDEGVKNVIRTKKIKCIKLPVNDPFMRVPETLHKSFLKHLSSDELLRISTVSKTWFNFTKASIGDRLMLILNCGVRQRKRNYCNIHAIINPNMSFRIFFSSAMFLTEMYIEVEAKAIRKTKILLSQCGFPTLRVLIIACHESSDLDDLQLPTSLTSLHLTNFTLKSRNVTETFFFKFLSQARRLQDLQFFECLGLHKLFMTDVSENFPFQLHKLKLTICKNYSEISKNFNLFLKTQSKTLKFLSLVKFDAATICNLVENCKLDSLKLMILDGPLDALKRQKAQMETLIDLQLPTNSCRDQFGDFWPYLKISTKLKYVQIRHLTNDVLHVTESLKHLEEVRYAEYMLENFPKQILDSYNGIRLIQDDLPFDELAEDKS